MDEMESTDISGSQNGEFRIGRVLSRSLVVFGHNIVGFGLIGLLVQAPVYLYIFFVGGTADPQVFAAEMGVAGTFIYIVGNVILGGIVLGALVFGTVRYMWGQPAGVGEILTHGVRVFLPVLGVIILSALIIMVGMILLIVPAFMFYTMLYAAICVAVVERPGVIASLHRSRELTKNCRWQILAIAILAAIVAYLIQLVFTSILDSDTVVGLIATLVAAALASVLGSVVTGVTYIELRDVKDGVQIDELAGVFD